MNSSYQLDETWIGKGLKFQNTFDICSGKCISNTGAERLHQSIYLILSTAIGERFLVPDFGSNLHKRIFEQNDDILSDMISSDIREALGKWEPRIEILSIDIKSEEEGNTLPVVINYRVRSTNFVDNYVYPFRRNAQPLGGELEYE